MNKELREEYEMQGALKQQEMEAMQNANAPRMVEEFQQSQAVLVEQTNPKKVVRDIMLRLQGKMRVADGSEVEVSEPKLNKLGLGKIWFILESHINQNIILSHLDRDEIGKIMMGLSEDLVDNLALNCKNYGIIDKTDLDDINDSILMNVYASLKRAEGQNEKNWLSKISIENISGAPRMMGRKKEGFWSKFKL